MQIFVQLEGSSARNVILAQGHVQIEARLVG